MEKQYKELLPEWFEEQKENHLVLSDDLDSLVSCAILYKVNRGKVRYFYDFEHLYISNKIEEDKEQRIWVDVAVVNGERAFDNHVSMFSIMDSQRKTVINPNEMFYITKNNYEEKYAGSTALMLWSLYDLPLPVSEKGKMLLLCIDSAYKGYYSEKFCDTNLFYLVEVLGMEELHQVLQRHTIDEFEEVAIEFGMKAKITYESGAVKSRLDIERIGKEIGLSLDILEDDYFSLIQEYDIYEQKVWKERELLDVGVGIVTLAFTYKNKIRYSKKKRKTDQFWWVNFNF